MLYLKNISKKFNGIEVLKNLSCEVKQDDFVIVTGPNGTGKSTLFDIISGKTVPDQGSLVIEGFDLAPISEEKRSLLVGRLFQNTYLGSCAPLTVRENLALAQLKGKRATLALGTKKWPEEVMERAPQNLKLEGLLDVPMGALSGGQRQMISFLMATLTPPKILLLDEPTAALDPDSATQLLSFARDFAKKHRIPTLLITHDPQIAQYLGNRLWILNNGSIAKEFGMEKSNMELHQFFQPIEYGKLIGSV